MGNTGVSGVLLDDGHADGSGYKEVVLCLHAVHNIEHLPTESYYGMVADDAADSQEVAVTSERPARLRAGLDTVLTVRIFLHERGAPSKNDRAIGGVVIRIRDMLETCGPGIYQTWFPVDGAVLSRGSSHRSGEKFRTALKMVTQHTYAPRVCLTLMEASVDPKSLFRDDASRSAYYGPLLVSHTQLAQMSRAYLDLFDRGESHDEPHRRHSASSGPPEPADLHRELERVQQQRLQEEEVAGLQMELDQVTAEANKRIENGNESILRLKAQLRQLRDSDMPELQRERTAVQLRIAELQCRNSELKAQVDDKVDNWQVEQQTEEVRKEVQVLADQKAALLKMVQGIYGEQPSQQVSSVAKAQMPGVGHAAIGSPSADTGFGKLLPHPNDVLTRPR